MQPTSRPVLCTLALCFCAADFLCPPPALAADCNTNGVEDAQDISGGTSPDCDVNAVPDECQPNSNLNATIDACHDCGTQLTDNLADDFWSIRQRSTSRGKVIWFDIQDDVYFFDGAVAPLIQPRTVNNVDLGGVANFVFALGSAAQPDRVLALWRRGTDDAWIWTNNGQDPRKANYTNPYDPTRAMNPEDVAIADGCIFLLLQASDPATNVLIKHVYRVDPVTGDSTLLTGDFLADTQTGGSGGEVDSLVTDSCTAAWSWCGDGNAGSCTGEVDLHYYNGGTTTVLDTNARALGLARGRLLYSKPVNGVVQLFLYDTNVANPDRVQLTDVQPLDKQILHARTDGRYVAMLVADAGGQNREIVLLGGLALTDATSQPTDTPPNPSHPFQLDRGQLLWTAQNTSVKYFDGRTLGTVCREGWLADGHVAQLRRSSASGADLEVFLAAKTPPADDQQPVAPMLVRATTTASGEVTVSWSTVLGATGYNVYYARKAGVNNANHGTLPGGGTLTNVAGSPAVVTGLVGNELYYSVVASVEGAVEGPVSAEATANPCLDPTLDGDSDGTVDCSDACPSDPAKTEPGLCGCGVAEGDADNDGVPDCQDACPADPAKDTPGVCGCGVPDLDADGDGTLDCDDLCPSDAVKTEPGLCGCGIPDSDLNGDGVVDCDEQVGGETPGDGNQTGCAPGLCGPGAVPLLPLTLGGLALMRRRSTRAR